MRFPAGDKWRLQAACLGMDTESIFFPSERSLKKINAAKAICRGCVCRVQCVEYAIKNNCEDGIFGGATPSERVLMSALLPTSSSSDDLSDTPSLTLVSEIHTVHHTDSPTLEQLPAVLDQPFVLNVVTGPEWHSQNLSENEVGQVVDGSWTSPFRLQIAL